MATAEQKIRVEIEITVSPWTAEQVAEDAAMCGLDPDDYDTSVDAFDIGDCIASLFYEGSEHAVEAFAGSGIYVNLGEATMIRAERVQP